MASSRSLKPSSNARFISGVPAPGITQKSVSSSMKSEAPFAQIMNLRQPMPGNRTLARMILRPIEHRRTRFEKRLTLQQHIQKDVGIEKEAHYSSESLYLECRRAARSSFGWASRIFPLQRWEKEARRLGIAVCFTIFVSLRRQAQGPEKVEGQIHANRRRLKRKKENNPRLSPSIYGLKINSPHPEAK